MPEHLVGRDRLALAAVCLAGREAIVLGESHGEITSKADVERGMDDITNC
jgi:hypothetical protein